MEKADMEKLLVKHHGNISAVAKEARFGGRQISRQALTRHLDRMGLVERAESLRAIAGVSGPRATLVNGADDPAAERARVVQALASSATAVDAAAALGISRRTLFRRVNQYNISEAQVLRARRRLGEEKVNGEEEAPV